MTVEKEENEKKEERSSFWSSYAALYAYSDSVDVKLMCVGLVGAILQAIIPPFVWFIVGEFVSHSINREFEEAGSCRANESLPVVEEPLLFLPETDEEFDVEVSRIFYITLGLSCAMFFIALIQRLAWELSAIRQVFRIKKTYIRKLLSMDVAWLESRHSGQVASMLHEHTDAIHVGISDNVPMLVYIITFLISNIGLCLQKQWDVTLVMCSAIPAIIGVRILFSKWVCSTLDLENELENKITNLASEAFSCIRTIFSFGAQKQTIGKFERLTNEHDNLREKRLRFSSVFDSLCQVLMTELIFTLALCYGIYRIDMEEAGKLSSLCINLLYMCTTTISIGFHLNGSTRARRNAAQMSEILGEAPLIESSDSAEDEKRERPSGRGFIRFDDVRFSYPSRPDIEVLKGISFSVEEGEHLAVVGPSGSGKSTLTALLLRFYDPGQGTISLGGVDIRRLRPAELRAECAIVSQEPVLFDGTIGENIRYGRLEATQLEMQEAARRVGAWSFISSLPDGMQTRVGDRGHQLSGGQKQRVAITRAVLRKPKVIIFDEATSALDKKHEEEVQTALDAAATGITSITISHRLSTVRTADRVLVLDEGRIIEEGPPDELLANENGRFYRMYMDERLDMLAATVGRPSGGAPLSTLSFSQADLSGKTLDAEAQRRAWARSSLGGPKKLGRSYSVISMDRQKLTLPVVTRKSSTRSVINKYTNNMKVELEDDVKLDDEELKVSAESDLRTVLQLVKRFRAGWAALAAAIPITVVRSAFYLLICFQIADFLAAYNTCTEAERTDYVFEVSAIYIALIIVKTIFEAVGRMLVAHFGHGFCSFLRVELLRSILRHGATYFDEERNSPGRLTHKLIHDTSTLDKMVASKLDLLIPSLVCASFGLGVALWINWKLALLCGFQFPVYFIVRLVQIKQGSKRQRRMLEEEKKAADLTAVVLSNMSTIKAYGLQRHFIDVFGQTLKPLARSMRWQSLVSAFVFASEYSITYILISLTLHFGRTMMLAHEINLLDYIRVVLLTQFGASLFSQLVASVSDLSKAKVAAENIMDVLQQRPQDVDNLSEEGLRPKLQGSIRLEDVEFRYPARPGIAVLKKLTMNIKAGESVAVVGPSGSGKSTIFSLLQRMYSPTQGQVMLDAYSARSINPSYLRRVVVSVGQEPTLFSFTIRENIAFGLLESEATQSRVEEAARVANIHDFIVSLPQGYDTEVGEFGAQLSGGQKQRIAIARAIIRRPAVLLLDEATAALDSVSEKAVQSALEKASRLCTCVQIAHRLSTIRNVNRIYVLVEGEIHEQGSHAELMELKGLYYEMNQVS